MEPFTVKNFFPTGDPSGLRVSFVRDSPVKAFYIPRNCVKVFRTHYKRYASLEGVYMLFNINDLHDPDKKNWVYIGKTDNILTRIRGHSAKKDREHWWNLELVFTIDDRADPLTDSDISSLEYLMCKKGKHSSLFTLKGNKQQPKLRHLSEDNYYHVINIFRNINILAKTLGFDVFLNINKDKPALDPRKLNHDKTVFTINRKGRAYAKYTNNGLMILAGSRVAGKALDSYKPSRFEDWPIKDGVFTKNRLCKSPSEASMAILKASTDGWREWKKLDNQKITLDMYYR